MSSSKAWKNDEKNLISDLLITAKRIPLIEAYLLEEINYLKNNIDLNATVIDFGCGNGRHLNILKNRIDQGLGVDMNKSYLAEASQLCLSDNICFEVGDIENYQAQEQFDVAIAMYNTFGNVDNPQGMIESMMRSIKENGKIIISIFSSSSVAARLDMYSLLDLKIDIDGYKVTSKEGLTSRCFTEDMIYAFMPNAKIEKCTDIGWIVVLEQERLG